MFKQTHLRSALSLLLLAGALAAMPSKASAEIVFDRGNDIYATNDDGSGLHLLYAASWVGMDGGLGSPAVAPNGSTLLFRGTTFRNHYVTPHGNAVNGLNTDGTYVLSSGDVRRLDDAPAPAVDPQGNPLAYETGSETPEPAPGSRYVYQAAQCTEYFNSGFGIWAVDCDHQLESAPLSTGTAAATQLPSACDGTGSGVADPSPDPASTALRVAYVGCLSTPPNPLESPKGEVIVTQSGVQHVVATGADNSGFHDPSFSSDGTKLVAFNDGGTIDDLDTGYHAVVTPGLYLYSDLAHTTAGRLLLAAPTSGDTNFASPRFMGSNKIAFVNGGSVWSIPATCSSCSFPADATKLYDGGSDAATKAFSVSWTSGSVTPGSPPPPPPPPGPSGGSSGGTTTTPTGHSAPDTTGTTSPAGTDSGPNATIAGLGHSMKWKSLLGKGLRFKVSCAAPCRLTASLVLDGKNAHRLHLARAKSVVIGQVTRKLQKAGSTSVLVHVSKKARKKLGRARSLKLTLRTVVTDAAGGHRTISRSLRVRR